MRKLIAAVVALSVLAPNAQAMNMNWLTQYKKPNLHVGQVELHPYYGIAETYDTNIYLVPRDQPSGQVGGGVRSSWITKNNLGLEILAPWRKLHSLSVGYDFEAQNYATQPGINDTINQRAHIDYTYAGAYGVTFKAGDQYINTTDQAFSELIERERRWANRVYSELDYAPERTRLTAGVDAENTMHKYVSPDLGKVLNRYEQWVGFNVGYRVQPKTRVYAAYHRGITHYTVDRQPGDQDKDNKSHKVSVGVRGVLNAKLEGKVETGMIYREYDEAPIGGATSVTRNLMVDTSLIYRPQDRTTFTLSASRRLQESVAGPNRFFIANDVGLDVTHKLPRKFSVGGMVAFAVDKYTEQQTLGGFTTDRRDDIYQGGAWIAYDIQEWLSAGLSYVYRERNSTLTGQFNYEDQQTSLNLAAKF